MLKLSAKQKLFSSGVNVEIRNPETMNNCHEKPRNFQAWSLVNNTK